MKPVCILSTTVLPLDGNYIVQTLKGEERETVLNSLTGVPHYVGHPDTKTICEALGAVPAPTKLFSGLNVGESAVCVPIKQGLSTRATDGFTAHQAISEIGTLDVRVVTRLGDNDVREAENFRALVEHLGSTPEARQYALQMIAAGDGMGIGQALAQLLNEKA